MSQSPILRRCVACKKVLDRKFLLKVTKDFQNGVVLSGGMGRSAYLCPTESCFEEALKRKRLQKALRCDIHSSVFNMLQKQLNTCIDSDSEA
ncbi:YlxR family protein [Prochlorococcus marinus]|uniref:YlxR family protein n=1 Tax=Prochlorococcus marinus TaxID=1219 RepID=UPI0022B4661A|nr:YlxR family protein [Prochlorococcus marinus]